MNQMLYSIAGQPFLTSLKNQRNDIDHFLSSIKVDQDSNSSLDGEHNQSFLKSNKK